MVSLGGVRRSSTDDSVSPFVSVCDSVAVPAAVAVSVFSSVWGARLCRSRESHMSSRQSSRDAEPAEHREATGVIRGRYH